MEVFPEKVASLPLPVVEVSPRQPGLSGATRPPLRLTLAKGDYRSGQLAAFAGGQGAADLTWIDEEAGIIEVQARRALGLGRSRYNITAPATDGHRYYWYSHTWIVGQSHKD